MFQFHVVLTKKETVLSSHECDLVSFIVYAQYEQLNENIIN